MDKHFADIFALIGGYLFLTFLVKLFKTVT